MMNYPTYEIGSLPKLNARVQLLKGLPATNEDLMQARQLGKRFNVDISTLEHLALKKKAGNKLTTDEKQSLIDLNALLNLRIQEGCGLDFVYDGEARRVEMYKHAVDQIEGFEPLTEMIRSRGPDSYRMAVCVSEPHIKNPESLPIAKEFSFVKSNVKAHEKVCLDDPYMITVMSDNRFYYHLLSEAYENPRELKYAANSALNLALARNVIRPQVEEVVKLGAKWVQLDIPQATIDIEHIPIMVEGINEVVRGFNDVKFSLHMCYPRRATLTDKTGYELLFPHVLSLAPSVNHFSLELANNNNYEQDLSVFRQYHDQRAFEIGLGVIDITLEQQRKNTMETPQMVADRIRRATETLGDASLVYVAPDCGMRQLKMDRCIRLYEVMVEGAQLARKG